MIVRNSWVTKGKEASGFIDAADFEEIEQEGDAAVEAWIDDQINGTSVTVVLVGAETCDSKWVTYEIDRSKELSHGLLGVDISKIKDFNGETTERCGQIPTGYPFYLWNKNDGCTNLGEWIETAAKAAGK